jgi:hypothetical protein
MTVPRGSAGSNASSAQAAAVGAENDRGQGVGKKICAESIPREEQLLMRWAWLLIWAW